MTTQQNEPPRRLLYPVNDVATLLGISRSGVYNLINDGSLKAVQIGGRRLVPADSLSEFIDRLMGEVDE